MARTARYTIRLPGGDLERVKAAALAEGRSLPDFIRRRLLGQAEIPLTPSRRWALVMVHRLAAGEATAAELAVLHELNDVTARAHQIQETAVSDDAIARQLIAESSRPAAPAPSR